MRYTELVKANSETKIDQYLYGIPRNLGTKYEQTYNKIGKVLADSPGIYKDLRVSGLGSTNSLYSLVSILSQLPVPEEAVLEKYNLFELGRGKAAHSFTLIKDIQIPLFNTAGVPIYLIKEDILSPLKHLEAVGERRINLLDFDSCSSLTGAAGLKLESKILTTLAIVLRDESIVHLNFVVKSFRIKSNYDQFTTKLTLSCVKFTSRQ